MASVTIPVKILADAARAQLRKLNTKSSKSESNFRKLNKQTNIANKNFKMMVGLLSGLGLGFAAKTALNYARGMTEIAAALETTSVKFEVLTGSIEVANQLMKDLEEFSAQTPFQFTEIEDAATGLLAFGFSVDEVKVKVREIGDIAAATGKDYRELAVVFGQVKSAGRLTGERLLQLQERSVPIMAALAKSMDTTEKSVRAMVQKGKVDFKTFERAWSSMSEAGGFAFEGMVKRSQTLEGRISTLNDNWVLLSDNIGKKFLPFAKTAVAALSKLLKTLKDDEGFQRLVDQMVRMLPLMIEFSGIVAVGVAKGIQLITKSFFNAAIGAIEFHRAFARVRKIMTGFQIWLEKKFGTEEAVENLRTFGKELQKDIDQIEKRQQSIASAGAKTNSVMANMVATTKRLTQQLNQFYAQEEQAAKDRADAKDKANQREIQSEQEKLTTLELMRKAEDARLDEAKDLADVATTVENDKEFQFLAEHLTRMEALRTLHKAQQLENEGLHDQAIELLNRKREKAELAAFRKKEKRDQDILKARGQFLNHMTTLQNASSKELVAIGKAAALAQITINTAESASAGMLWGTRIGGPALGAIFAGLAYTAGAAQAAQVMGAKFRDGGIVAGNQTSGDQVQARLNSGEMVLNKQQQTNLFKMAQQGGGMDGKQIVVHSTIELDGEVLARSVSRSVANGVELGEFE